MDVKGWARELQDTSHLDGPKVWEEMVEAIAEEARKEKVRPRCVGIYRNHAGGDGYQCELLAPHEGKCRPVEPLNSDESKGTTP